LYCFGGEPNFPDQEFIDKPAFYPLSGNTDTPYAESMEEITQIYRNGIGHSTFGSETNFLAMIEKAVDEAEQDIASDNRQNYRLLFIMTPQDLNDVPAFQKLMVKVSNLPISIIFVDMQIEPLKAMGSLPTLKPVKN